MILRNYHSNKFIKINVNNEEQLLKDNPNFISVDTLPESEYGFYILENGSYIVDEEKVNELNEVYKQIEETKAILQKIEDYKNYLNETDHKVFPYYEPKDGENINDIIIKRSEARKFIREN